MKFESLIPLLDSTYQISAHPGWMFSVIKVVNSDQASMRPYRLMQPRVEPCTSNAQQLAHQADRVLVAMLIDKAALHSGSLAKYRTAF